MENITASRSGKKQTILILLNGGLRSFVFAEGAIRVLRQNYKDANLLVLTDAETKLIAEKSGYFDKVLVDGMYHWSEVHSWWALRGVLLNLKFDMVIDLENSVRTHLYFRLAGRKKPQWSCNLSWCSHPYNPPAKYMNDDNESVEEHVVDNHVGILGALGIKVDADDVHSLFSWVDADTGRFKLSEDYVLINPVPPEGNDDLGWDLENYVDFIEYLEQNMGIQTVLVSARADAVYAKKLLARVVLANPVNLMGKANNVEVAELAKNAHFALGNDQGAMYLVSYMGCPTVFMLSEQSNCGRWLPLRSRIRAIRSENIRRVPMQTVFGNINLLIGVDTEPKIYTSEGEEIQSPDEE